MFTFAIPQSLPLREGLEAGVVAARAHPAQDLLNDTISKRILGRHPAPSRKLDLVAGNAADPRLFQPDLPAAEHQASLVVTVPVRPSIRAGLMTRAAQHRAILLSVVDADLPEGKTPFERVDFVRFSFMAVVSFLSRNPMISSGRRPPSTFNAQRDIVSGGNESGYSAEVAIVPAP